MKTVEIIRFPQNSKVKCSSPKCDGRPARWYFPQAPNKWAKNVLGREHMTACNVHLAAIAFVVETWHVQEKTPC